MHRSASRRLVQRVSGVKYAFTGVLYHFVILLALVGYLPAQVTVDKNQFVHESVEGERDCGRDDWTLALDAEKSGVIKSDVLPTQKCRAISLRWLPGAQIVQLSGVEHRDVFVCMTFVRVDGLSPTRMVRALGGLVTHKELENDSANKAVFNELLHQSKYRPNDDQFIDLAILYLFMVGHPPDETPRRLEGMAKANDFTGFVARKKHKVIVTIHQRKALLGIPCREWKVEFHLARKEIDLTSATPE